MDSKSPLRQLVDIISTSVDRIESVYAGSNLQYPTLDVPFSPENPAEILAITPEIVQAAQLALAACGQLAATLKVPNHSLYEVASGFHVSSALRVAMLANISEILREAGDQGLHTKDIAARSGLDPLKQARILRLLATYHVFREITPNVFTNNRLSSTIDIQKSVDEIRAAPPEDKHIDAPGPTALYEHTTDEVFKGSTVMAEVLLDPNTSHSEAQEEAPMMIAVKRNKSIWEWYEEPDNTLRRKRFDMAMVGNMRMETPDAILQGFDWSSLAPGSLVVDVGGGVGSTSIKVARMFPTLRYVVQDRPGTIEAAKKYWSQNLPQMLQDGSVELQVHDFFTPQPRKNATVFLLRKILHDYGRQAATKILKHLRDAATPETKLVLVEILASYACHDVYDVETANNIQGIEKPQVPSPLLPNLGRANAHMYHADIQMCVALNGEERTIGSFVDVTRESGWKIERVFSIDGSPNKHIVAIPI